MYNPFFGDARVSVVLRTRGVERMEHNNRMMTALAFMAVVAVSITSLSYDSDASTGEGTTQLETVEFIKFDDSEWITDSKACEILTDSQLNWDDQGDNQGWYAVSDKLIITDTWSDERVQINGDINLILKDGAYLELPDGIHLSEGNSLTIYSQKEGTGKLVSKTENPGMSGIGGDSGNRDTDFSGEDAGTLTIHGGIITAIGSQDYYSRYGGAGIGGGGCSSQIGNQSGGDGGEVTIYGGTIVAIGGIGSAGIGGGSGFKSGGSGGTVHIYGGNITAIGGYNDLGYASTYMAGSGIGTGGGKTTGSSQISGGTISIAGGTVTAIGGLETGSENTNINTGVTEDKYPSIPGLEEINNGRYYEIGATPGLGSSSDGAFKLELSGGALICNSTDDEDSDWNGIVFINPKLRYYITDPDGNYFNHGDRDVDGDGITTVDVTGKVHGTSVTLTADLHIPDGYTLEIDSGKTLIIQNGATLTNDHKIISYGVLKNEGTISGNANTSDKGIWLNNTESQTIDGEVSGNYLHCYPVINIHFKNSDGKDVTEVTSGEQINVIVTVTSGAGNILIDGTNVPEVTLSLGNEKANTSLVQGKYVFTFTISVDSNLLVVGKNTITASISQTGHFLSGGSASATLTVTENEEDGEIEYKPSADVSVTFDGESHTISPPECSADAGCSIAYSTSTGTDALGENTFTLTAPPSFTEAGTYTVWYRITSDGLTPVVDSATVTISPAQITGTLVVEGHLGVGERLTANLTTAIQTGFVYQWYVGGVPIDGATGTSYTPTESDIGKTIMVTASADDGNYCGYLWAFAQGSNGSSADGDVPSQDGQPSVQPPAVPDYPVFVPDDDYVPLPPNIVIEEDDSGNDDTENILAVVAAAVFAALVGVYLWGDRRRQ